MLTELFWCPDFRRSNFVDPVENEGAPYYVMISAHDPTINALDLTVEQTVKVQVKDPNEVSQIQSTNRKELFVDDGRRTDTEAGSNRHSG